MKILSISFAGYHDSAAALVADGIVMAAAEEERFTRRKHENQMPWHAIEFCLKDAGLSMADIDCLAIPEKPFRIGADSYLSELDWLSCWWMFRHGSLRFRSVLSKILLEALRVARLPQFNAFMYAPVAEGLRSLRRRYGTLPPIRFYSHHHCHAAATYFTSGLERAAVVTIDGGGGLYATVTWQGEDRSLRRLRAECLPNALGVFYEECTDYLGLGPYGEGKAMGLASYGDPAPCHARVSELLSVNADRWYERRSTPNPVLLGFEARNGEEILHAPFPDFAAAAQAALESAVRRVVQSAMADTAARSLCLGGGVMLNCSSNGALLRSGIARNIWVFPAAGDAGLSVGAALLAAAESGAPRAPRLLNAYLGPAFDTADYEASLLREPRVTFTRVANVAESCAEMLASGNVIGWFQGRMELGPRALGNRSILADVRTVEMRDRVNRIKRRELWRPLAPVVLAERAAEFFTPATESPFMLFAVEVLPEKRGLIAAVSHVDGSARPQTVTREQNRILHDLLSAYDRLTGIPVLLNTSFNDAGEPIVCTPDDAIKAFLRMRFDALVLGHFIVRRRDQKDDESRGATHAA